MSKWVEHNCLELAVYAGELYHAHTGRCPKGHVMLGKMRGRSYSNDEGFAYSSYSNNHEKHVPIETLEAWYIDKMEFTWRGKSFSVVSVDGERVLGELHDDDRVWAKENGLESDHYWCDYGVQHRIWLNIADIEKRVARTDYLARWASRRV